MKERPILFSAPMVRALLDSSKTQTRRAVKLPHQNPLGVWEATTVGGENGGRTHDGNTIPAQGGIWHTRTGDCIVCPYGQPGDRLWVRETHRPIFGQTCGLIAVDYRADPREKWERLGDAPECLIKGVRWTPSIHMRREYSRILLEIVSVRVERLNDISNENCIAEGIHLISHGCEGDFYHHESTEPYPQNKCYPDDAYRALWESINGPGNWATNPWVWVVEFKLVTA